MIRSAVSAVIVVTSSLFAQQPPVPPPVARPQAPAGPIFRGGINLVRVDVAVRDRRGRIIRGLQKEDFELLEDGKPQEILTFRFEEISTTAPVEDIPALAAISKSAAAGSVDAAADQDQEPKPLTPEDTAGRRLMVLLFDTSSMQPEDVQKAADSAVKWVDEDMTTADLVAVAQIGSSNLEILSDFTSDKEKVRGVLGGFTADDGPAPAADSSTAATDAADADTTADAATVAEETTTAAAADVGAQELDTFNNDVRLRAITTLAEALTPIPQKKAILYFSSGMQRNGSDNQIELRKTINTAIKANIAIYPVDSRGLQAVVPGGDASQASRGGVTAFSGRGVAQQFSRISGQQETLQALAQDTGGRAFTETNDFGEAFERVSRDISSYYLLGFSSTNPNKDGRFRRIRVRLKPSASVENARINAREGYYADRDFAHTGRTDREALLQEQLQTPIPLTDVPMFVSAGWFRVTPERYYVPVSLAVPGSAVPVTSGKTTLDIAGVIRDERGARVGRIRDTLTVPPIGPGGLAARQVLYQTGITLPPGRFSVKIVVRENANGRMGTFETAMLVPELEQAPVKVSSVVLSTQLKAPPGGRTQNPLARNGVELVPNLTHIINRNQKMYVYYEVYEPTLDNGNPQLRTGLVFYRGQVKVFETPIVERSQIDLADRKAALFQFEVPVSGLKPGLYTCQINIVDAVAGTFVFPRFDLYVR